MYPPFFSGFSQCNCLVGVSSDFREDEHFYLGAFWDSADVIYVSCNKGVMVVVNVCPVFLPSGDEWPFGFTYIDFMACVAEESIDYVLVWQHVFFANWYFLPFLLPISVLDLIIWQQWQLSVSQVRGKSHGLGDVVGSSARTKRVDRLGAFLKASNGGSGNSSLHHSE